MVSRTGESVDLSRLTKVADRVNCDTIFSVTSKKKEREREIRESECLLCHAKTPTPTKHAIKLRSERVGERFESDQSSMFGKIDKRAYPTHLALICAKKR